MEGPFNVRWAWPDAAAMLRADHESWGHRSMVAIPRQMAECVLFLYKSRDHAERHVKEGGTAFILSKKVEGTGKSLPYLVSNRHVVFEAAASVVRVNRKDGKPPDIFETDPSEWTPHPDGDDLVVRRAWDLEFSPVTHKVAMTGAHECLTEADIKKYDIGVGDEAFMLGRFVNHQGKVESQPAARFGCISVMNSPIPHPIYNIEQDAFAVEMRSRTGFSGSPVWTYGTPFTTIKKRDSQSKGFFCVLGVNWGYILDEEGENTWLNGVVPAWKILDILNLPELVAEYEQAAAMDLRMTKGEGGGIKLAVSSSDPSSDHRERFNRLLDAAVKPKK